MKTTRADDAKAVVRQALASNPTFSIGGYCATVGMGMPNKNSIDENLTISAFSNRPFKVKRFQTVHHGSIDVAYGLVLFSESAGGRPGKYA